MESEGGKREPQGEQTFCLTIARGIALCCMVFVCDSVQSHKDSLSQVYMVFLWSPQPEACLLHDLRTHTPRLAK